MHECKIFIVKNLKKHKTHTPLNLQKIFVYIYRSCPEFLHQNFPKLGCFKYKNGSAKPRSNTRWTYPTLTEPVVHGNRSLF